MTEKVRDPEPKMEHTQEGLSSPPVIASHPAASAVAWRWGTG